MSADEYRVCTSCGEIKSLTGFPRVRSEFGKPGVEWYKRKCRACYGRDNAAYARAVKLGAPKRQPQRTQDVESLWAQENFPRIAQALAAFAPRVRA